MSRNENQSESLLALELKGWCQDFCFTSPFASPTSLSSVLASFSDGFSLHGSPAVWHYLPSSEITSQCQKHLSLAVSTTVQSQEILIGQAKVICASINQLLWLWVAWPTLSGQALTQSPPWVGSIPAKSQELRLWVSWLWGHSHVNTPTMTDSNYLHNAKWLRKLLNI